MKSGRHQTTRFYPNEPLFSACLSKQIYKSDNTNHIDPLHQPMTPNNVYATFYTKMAVATFEDTFVIYHPFPASFISASMASRNVPPLSAQNPKRYLFIALHSNQSSRFSSSRSRLIFNKNPIIIAHTDRISGKKCKISSACPHHHIFHRPEKTISYFALNLVIVICVDIAVDI